MVWISDRFAVIVGKRDVLRDAKFVAKAEAYRSEGSSLPATRNDCPDVRPCPHVSCRHNLTLDITPRGGLMYVAARRPVGPHEDIDEVFGNLERNCTLDYAKLDGMTHDEIGQVLGITRERVRQIEEQALRKARKALIVSDWYEGLMDSCNHMNNLREE